MKKVFYFLFPFSYKIKCDNQKEWDYVFEKRSLYQFALLWFTLGECFFTLLLVLEELFK